jgi:hypothetical protein
MQPPDETGLPAEGNLGARRRLTLWVSLNRPLAWLISLLLGLVLFLARLVEAVRQTPYIKSLMGHLCGGPFAVEDLAFALTTAPHAAAKL